MSTKTFIVDFKNHHKPDFVKLSRVLMIFIVR